LIGQIDNVGGAVRYINLDALHAKRKTQCMQLLCSPAHSKDRKCMAFKLL